MKALVTFAVFGWLSSTVIIWWGRTTVSSATRRNRHVAGQSRRLGEEGNARQDHPVRTKQSPLRRHQPKRREIWIPSRAV